MIPALVLAAALCTEPLRIPAGPAHTAPQCNYNSGSLAAHGDYVYGTWMTSRVGCCSPGNVTGSLHGAVLDEKGALREPVHRDYFNAPALASSATNGMHSLVAYAVGAGTFFQFADAAGALAVPAIKLGDGKYRPRALWNGSDWVVVGNDGGAVIAWTIKDDGTIASQVQLETAGTVSDLTDGLALVSTSSGAEAVTLAGARYPLPEPGFAVAREDGGYLVAWKDAANNVGVRRLNAAGMPIGDPIPLETNLSYPRTMDVVSLGSESLVFWSNENEVRAAIVRGSEVVQRFNIGLGLLHEAVATSRGVIVLISYNCGTASTFFLPRGGVAFEEPHPVSVAYTPQSPRAAAPTALGTQVLWTELVPGVSSTMRLYSTFADTRARAPIPLNEPNTYIFDIDAAPMRDGTVVAWSEYAGAWGATARVARFNATGELIGGIVNIAAAPDIQAISVAANDDAIYVVTAEKPSFTYYSDLYATRLTPALAATSRSVIATRVEAFGLDAVTSGDGVTASWVDQIGGVQTNLREPQALHVFTFMFGLDLFEVASNGQSSRLVYADRNYPNLKLHTLSSDGSDVVIAGLTPGKIVTARIDGAFRVFWAETDAESTVVRSTTGIDLCFAAGFAYQMTLRDGRLDALVTQQSGRVYVTRTPLPRRRAVR